MSAPDSVFPTSLAPTKLQFRTSSSLSETPLACPMVLPVKPRSQRFGSVSMGGRRTWAIAAGARAREKAARAEAAAAANCLLGSGLAAAAKGEAGKD